MKKLSLDELNRIDIEQFKEAEKLPLIIVLDNIRSMNNIGSFFRTSDAFRVSKIILTGITATPPNKEITKTALGSTESVDWEYGKNTINVVNRLRNSGYAVYSVEQCEEAQSLDQFSISGKGKIALVFGNEIKGVQQEVIDNCDGCIEIPQFGTKHSFNVSVSGGIVLWDLFLKYKDRWSTW
ncbi:MAG: RNA methyltransferase [Bacteroidales bacterium]|nr:RNA methyltransferase [Bacteroidales bacterium]